jgi:hypothetical protein
MSRPPTECSPAIVAVARAWIAWLGPLLCLMAMLMATNTVVAYASGSTAATSAPSHTTVTVRTSSSGTRLRAGFVGLGVVADALARDQFAHTNLADYLKLLGRHGTLRIGGNRVDSFWTSTGQPAPTWSHGEITPADLRALAKTVSDTGWRVILGVPIMHTNPARSADEAQYAERILRSKLLGIEIGNEPNLYGISESAYFTKFERDVHAITAAVPGVSIVGPAMGRAAPGWVSAFARDEAPRPDIALLTTHEYPLSVCNGQHPTIAQLLSTSSERHETAAADSAVASARTLGVPAAIDETNSAICWGAQGVSNTFASALWVLDYGLLLAQHGVASANFQTRISGCTPYLPLCTAAHSAQLFARPELYGLLALRLMGTGTFLKAVTPDSVQLRAYAVANGPQRLSIALDNLGPALTVRMQVSGEHLASGRMTLLRTSSSRGLAATSRISLGGRQIGGDGRFQTPLYTRVAVAGSVVTIHVAAHTAAIIQLREAAALK